MKLADWAKKENISYSTALRWFKAGKLPVDAYQTRTGTILVKEEEDKLEASTETFYLMLYNCLPNAILSVLDNGLKKDLFEFAKKVAENSLSLFPNSQLPTFVDIGSFKPADNRGLKYSKEKVKDEDLEYLPEHLELYNSVKNKLYEIYGDEELLNIPKPSDELSVNVLSEILSAAEKYMEISEQMKPATQEEFAKELQYEQEENVEKIKHLTKKLQNNELGIKRSNLDELLKKQVTQETAFPFDELIEQEKETQDKVMYLKTVRQIQKEKDQEKNKKLNEFLKRATTEKTKDLIEEIRKNNVETIPGTNFPKDPTGVSLTDSDINKIEAYKQAALNAAKEKYKDSLADKIKEKTEKLQNKKENKTPNEFKRVEVTKEEKVDLMLKEVENKNILELDSKSPFVLINLLKKYKLVDASNVDLTHQINKARDFMKDYFAKQTEKEKKAIKDKLIEELL